jgi:hypothetical protein
MHDVDDAHLKAEIDQIMKSIDDTIKKIEKIVPLKKEKVETSENETGTKT